MKPLVLGLLAASLAANIFLAWRARPAASVNPTSDSVAPASAPGAPHSLATAAAATNPHASRTTTSAGAAAVWRTGTTDQDLPRLVDNLRNAGFPASVIRAVINELLNERFAARRPDLGRPYWKNGALSPEMLAAQTALNAERRELFESLLGADARPSALIDKPSRERRYGSLPDDKVDALAKIERDYSEMTAEAWQKRGGNLATNMETAAQSQKLIEKEKLTDIAALLSPEEFAQYERRNSTTARSLIEHLGNLDVSEAEYIQLYEAQKAFDAAAPVTRTNADVSTFLQRAAAQQALNEQVHAVLGEDRFYSYLQGADFGYAQTARTLGNFPGVTPAASYQVYQMQVEAQRLTSRSMGSGPPSREKMEEIRTTMAEYNRKLEALVGAQAAEAYRKQGAGTLFRMGAPGTK